MQCIHPALSRCNTGALSMHDSGKKAPPTAVHPANSATTTAVPSKGAQAHACMYLFVGGDKPVAQHTRTRQPYDRCHACKTVALDAVAWVSRRMAHPPSPPPPSARQQCIAPTSSSCVPSTTVLAPDTEPTHQDSQTATWKWSPTHPKGLGRAAWFRCTQVHSRSATGSSSSLSTAHPSQPIGAGAYCAPRADMCTI